MVIKFEQLNELHFPLLLKWLETNHVKKWWDPDINYTLNLVRKKYISYVKGYKLVNGTKKPIQCFIIYNNQDPVGYIQLYNAHDFLDEKIFNKTLAEFSRNLGAFDIFIGEEEILCQGLGSKAISEFLKFKGKQYSHIFVNPDSSNIAAIKCYEKAGFKKISEQKTIDGILMIKDIS